MTDINKNSQPKYMGYREKDHSTQWAKYFNEKMPPIPPHVLRALENAPCEAGRIPPFSEAKDLANEANTDVETGYSLEDDGSLRVAILTKMPRVSPEMWDWWFGWHGCRDNRYKLWHPLAHKAAQWQDGEDKIAYIGRTSMIQEYIGKNFAKANICFIPPDEMGFGQQPDSVFICARVGYTNFPIDFGWLLHHVRATDDGAEMRSRFWLGGEHIKVRLEGAIPNSISKLLQKIVPRQDQRAKDILIHCAEEMNHLAQFLPELYAEFADK